VETAEVQSAAGFENGEVCVKDLPRIDRPQPMFGKCRLVRHGPFVPGRIWLDDSVPERPAVMLAEINGRETDAQEAWVRLAGHPITEAEYRYMAALKDHVEKYEPEAVEANPRKAIDFKTMPMPF
jgi:hypothetical protein